MLLVTFSPFRILQVFVIQLFLGIFFLYIASLILKRDKKRLNVILSSMFIFVFIGVIFNVIYAFLEDVFIIGILTRITVFFLFGAAVFPVVFNLILLKSEKIIDSKKQFLIIFGYLALVFLALLIPGGIIIEPSNDYVPQWSLELLLVMIIASIVYTAIPFIYTAWKINNKFEDDELKKKWKYYMYSMPFYHVNAVMVSLSNHLNDPNFRLMWNAVALILYLIAYFIYYGVGKQIDKDR